MLHDTTAATAPPWTPARLARLGQEWRRLQRAFAYHPHVDVAPAGDDPPAEYHVQYRVTTLAINDAGQLAYVTTFPVHVWLPPQFPHAAPVVRPTAAAFHPNVTAEWFHLNPPWHPEGSLVEVVEQVGRLLAFQTYDPNAIANPVAMNWALANVHLLPTDSTADLSPSAGGEPLARVLRFGAGTLQELHGRVESAIDRLAAAGAPAGDDELELLTREARITLGLFLERDVPEHLRSNAEELAELLESASGHSTPWEVIGRQVARAKAVTEAAREVEQAEEALRRALAADTAPPQQAGGAAAARVPSLAMVQPLALALRRAVREGDRAVGHLRNALAQFGATPRLPSPGTRMSLLSRRMTRELARLAAATEPARASGTTLASLDPVLHRARRESAAADRLTAWADHADFLRRGNEIVGRVRSCGPAALQAFTTDGPGGREGPFEYEQRVDPDMRPPLAVRNLRGSVIRVIDAATEEVIAQGDARVTLPARTAAGATAAPLSVHAAEHTDDIRTQLEYLLTQSRDALRRLRPSEEDLAEFFEPATWAGRLATELDQVDEQLAIDEEHRRSTEAWKQATGDLAALGRYKQRLATHHLLTRLTEAVPRLKADRARAAASIVRAEGRLAEIGARSGHDVESETVIVPRHFAAEYSAHVVERDRARQEIERIDRAMVNAAARVRQRLTKPKLYGSPEFPQMRLLAALPEPQPPLDLSDEALQRMVSRLEELLGVPLRAAPAADPDA